MQSRLLLFSIILLIVVFNLVAASGFTEGFDREDFNYEAILIRQLDLIEKINLDKSNSLIYYQLGSLRLKLAAYHYNNYLEVNRSPEEMQKALEYAASVTELVPELDEGWLMLGMLLSEFKADQKMMEKAAEALIKAVEINPANGRAQLLLARVLMEQGRFWSAIEQYKGLFAKDEEMISGINISSLTLAYIADGRIEAGLDYMTRLAIKYPENIWVNISLAIFHKNSGHLDVARLYLKTLLEKASLTEVETDYITALLKRWEVGE